jgi:hypothetical protein
VAHDFDEHAVERHYQHNRERDMSSVLPLLLDLTRPSPALGWALEERESALTRVAHGTVVALALIHHLAIANNVPLPVLARFFAGIAESLVIEFVPKDDSQVQRLLASRQDIFSAYSREQFEVAFRPFFETVGAASVPGSTRTLFAMKRRHAVPTGSEGASGLR